MTDELKYDEMAQYSKLLEVLQDFDTPSAVAYFKSEEA